MAAFGATSGEMRPPGKTKFPIIDLRNDKDHGASCKFTASHHSAIMNDRRRINGPSGGTSAPVFSAFLDASETGQKRPVRTRAPNALRKMFLRTGVAPSSSGSAYIEFESHASSASSSATHLSSLSLSGLKITCSVHGPRPLPRSVPFTPHLILTTHVKYAPFATQQRRGYLRDSHERDLAVHLETALRGIIIGDRWPKSGVEVIVTILEGEEDYWWGDNQSVRGEKPVGQFGMMSILSGCITVASAAIADAGIDCVDMVSGGVAALVRDQEDSTSVSKQSSSHPSLVLDPIPSEHAEILAACVVGYLPSRDEVTNLWMKGKLGKDDRENPVEASNYEILTESAVQAAKGSNRVLTTALRESVELKIQG